MVIDQLQQEKYAKPSGELTGGVVDEILKFAVENNASDVHFSSGMPPIIRILGEIKKVDMPPLEEESLAIELMSLLNQEQIEYFNRHKEIDLAVNLPGLSRFRANIFRHLNGIGAAFRIIPPHIRTLEEMHMPAVLKKMIQYKKGLILVTGPTGSGKSTTLAAMIHEINLSRREHIITIEDPIEYVHKPVQSLIHQREIGIHTQSFATALRSALREDPDIILVGEMRDLETITYALRAAETGHLVLSTLHTNSAAETVDRVINVFPGEQQPQIRIMMANALIGVISQRLVPQAMKPDRIALMEIMVNNNAIKNLIREGKTYQIESAIQMGSDFGMQTFEKSFNYLRHNNFISPQLRLSDFV